MIVNNKKLSKTSSKPGKTQLINHFLINSKFYFVDLPGYGWAQVSKTRRKEWKRMISNYILNSKMIVLIFILVDVRLKPQKIDIENINFIGKNNLPLNIIFTKCDKIGLSLIKKNIDSFFVELSNYWSRTPNYFTSSSDKNLGKDEIEKHISRINKSLN